VHLLGDAEEYSLSPPQKKHRLFGKDLILAVGKVSPSHFPKSLYDPSTEDDSLSPPVQKGLTLAAGKIYSHSHPQAAPQPVFFFHPTS